MEDLLGGSEGTVEIYSCVTATLTIVPCRSLGNQKQHLYKRAKFLKMFKLKYMFFFVIYTESN